jgi:hypothetical protein
MSDSRDVLTEETPETKDDFKKRRLTEVGGTTKAASEQRVLTEDLPEEEAPRAGNLFG